MAQCLQMRGVCDEPASKKLSDDPITDHYKQLADIKERAKVEAQLYIESRKRLSWFDKLMGK